VAVVVRGIVQIAGRHVELPELFFQRHAAEQVTHTDFDRKPGIAVGRRTLLLRL
jgi:hypothetical protein